MNSILNSVKKMLGIEETYFVFDKDIIVLINMAFNILTQLGVGPSYGFTIEDDSKTWDEFIQDEPCIEMVKAYVYLKVKQTFDPSASATMNGAVDNQIKELEWRLTVQVNEIKEGVNNG